MGLRFDVCCTPFMLRNVWCASLQPFYTVECGFCQMHDGHLYILYRQCSVACGSCWRKLNGGCALRLRQYDKFVQYIRTMWGLRI
ncbi:hypothetical protein COO60DRAFT_1558926 [Scenedesmus sp. NREL 46B-D3]|nr:hypothetical protein COO60DRAFT_1558926 [Scenedesmus sp. NREL 46B-D3]